ncbi:uncharacterized protein K02A2.6-like [Armigeres subalbatus]|uniref:uncharacterized protein K02A2.6-like n=1 Tax=Armigeres subalbatus TaxID=124917 RepID=UPI002ED027A3
MIQFIRRVVVETISSLSSDGNSTEYDSGTECIIKSVQECATIDIAEVITATSSDPELQKLIECINSNKWSQDDLKDYAPFRLELSSVNNLVMRGTKLVIPKCLRSRMCQLAHEGHPGQSMMKRRLRERCWWPGIDKEAVKICETCEGCQLVQTTNPPEPMMRRNLPEKPWIDVAIDFLGPMPTGEYILVIVDYYSRFMEIEIMQRITAHETIKRLRRIFRTWGPPRTITLDNAKQFISIDFEEFCKTIGIHLNHTSPYWPQANGEVERQNRSLLKRMKIAHALYNDWKAELDDYLDLYNNTPHTITGKAPSELLQGRKLRSKLPAFEDLESTPPSSDFRDQDFEKKMLQKEREDAKRRAKPSDISAGDVVLMKNLLPTNKLSTNFLKEKFIVLSRNGSNVTVQSNDTGKKYDRNISHLRKLIRPAQVSNSDSTSTPDNEDNSLDSPKDVVPEPSSSHLPTPTLRRSNRTIRPKDRFSPSR